MKKEKRVKRKIKWKVLVKLSFFLFFVGLIVILFKEYPTKHIIVNGNINLSDLEIIKIINYQDYPPLFSQSSSKIKENLVSNFFIHDAKVRKNFLGELILDIDEALPLYYEKGKKQLVLSDGSKIATNNLQGVPLLLNDIPEYIEKKLIDSLKKVDSDTIKLISEIKYDPWKSGDVVIDDTRFFLVMNDKNHVYINTINMEKLNNYLEIYATLETQKGTLYLDSSSDKISFSGF